MVRSKISPMSSSREVDPHDLTLPELPSDIKVKGGPVIDSSEEYPLPSLDFDLGAECDPDFLFPLDETTAEDLPVSQLSSHSSEPITDDYALPDLPELPPFPTLDNEPVMVESQDEDYFDVPQEGPAQTLNGEAVKMTPSPVDVRTETTTPAPPPAPTLSPPATVAAPLPDLSKPATAPQQLTAPGPPMAWLQPESMEIPLWAPEIEKATFSTPSTEPEKPTSLPPAPPAPGPARASGQNPDLYVRKSKAKANGGEAQGSRLRPWVPAAGIALIAVTYFLSKPFFARTAEPAVVDPVLVVASEPPGEVYADGEALGVTPFAVNSESVVKKLEIRRQGYDALAVPDMSHLSDADVVQKFVAPLVPTPVALSWTGLPAGATVWWNGKKSDPGSLKATAPGKYSVKVQAKGRPSVSVPLEVKPGGKPVQVGKLIEQQLAKQPRLKVSLSTPQKASAKGLAFKVTRMGAEEPFSQTVKVSSDKAGGLTLPASGKYKISFEGDETFKSTSQTVELGSGNEKSVKVTLAKQPPRPQPVATAPSSGSSSYYQPSAPAYQPYYPPAQYSGGGGGGGGRIRPPSF